MKGCIAFWLILLCLLNGSVTISSLNAQNLLEQHYTVSLVDMPIDSAINLLEKSCPIGFSYDPVLLSANQKVSLKFIQTTLKTILDSLFHPFHIDYKAIGSTIVLIPITPKITALENKSVAIRFTGKVMDASTGQPVPFANVFLKKNSMGTLTNQDGYYVLNIMQEAISDTVCVSSIGYKTLFIGIPSQSTEETVISLQPVPFKIPEVIVRQYDALEIVRSAVDKIKENYSCFPMMYTAFYRETVRQRSDYVLLSEAILSIYKASYTGMYSDQAKIVKGRKCFFEKQMDTVMFKFQGGIVSSLMLDIAKNSSIFLSEEYLSYYTFSLNEIINIGDRTTFVISFEQKDLEDFPLYKGKLFIDRVTLAIVRADFEISPKELDIAVSELVKKGNGRYKISLLCTRYVVDYTYRNNKWYLNDTWEELKLKVRNRHSLFATTYHTIAEMVVTRTDSTLVHRFKNNEVSHLHDIFVERTGPYDEAFWENYNFLKPEETIIRSLAKLKENTKGF